MSHDQTCVSLLVQLNHDIERLERILAAPFDIDMANDLMYLLPESQECATGALTPRRRHRELVRLAIRYI